MTMTKVRVPLSESMAFKHVFAKLTINMQIISLTQAVFIFLPLPSRIYNRCCCCNYHQNLPLPYPHPRPRPRPHPDQR